MSGGHGRNVLLGHLLQLIHLRQDVPHVRIELSQEVVALVEEGVLRTHVGEKLCDGREGGENEQGRYGRGSKREGKKAWVMGRFKKGGGGGGGRMSKEDVGEWERGRGK